MTENSWAVKLKELKIVNLQYLWRGWNDKECEESFRAEKAPFREFEVAFSNLDNTDWKSTLYISHSYLSLLSYIFYPIYFSFWLCALNHEKFILLQVEIKPLQKGGNRRKSLYWFSTYLYDIIKRFCLYLRVRNLDNFVNNQSM